MFKTRITEMLGIEYPIIQAAMMWVANAELVSAVSNAGGFGIICALSYSAEGLKQEIRKIRQLTSRPFGVNLTLLPTLKPVNYDEYINIIIGEGVKFVETAGRNPEQYMEKFIKADIKVIHKCTAVRFAQKAEKIGCSAVAIDGFEAAGHPGEDDVTSLILIPLTVDSVKIPVIASGGFSDARGLVAALSLGAQAVNMGTRFMATREAPLHQNIKQLLLNTSERDTILLLRRFANTIRVYNNAQSKKVADMERKGASILELASLLGGDKGREMLEKGDIDSGLLALGQSVGMVYDIPGAGELVNRIVKDADLIISELRSK